MPDEITFPANTGILISEPRINDIIAGGIQDESTITLVVGESWRSYLIRNEKQFGIYFDSMACLTFSALNVLEMMFKYMMAHDMISAENVSWLREKGYFNAQGEIEFSDRFTAKMSGTTTNGNYQYKVNDSICKYDGLVPESLWTWNADQRNPVFDWDDFYVEPPQGLKDLGHEFFEHFDIKSIFVNMNFPEAVVEALTHGPLQVIVHAWDLPVDGIYQRTTKTLNHAVCDFEPQTFILDHYPEDGRYGTDFIKQLAPNFIFHYSAYQFNIKEKFMENNFVKIIKDKNSKAVGFFIPATSPDALSTMAIAFNKTIERKPDGEIDWDKTIEGQMELEAGEEITE